MAIELAQTTKIDTIVELVEQGDADSATAHLSDLLNGGAEGLPRSFLEHTLNGLRTGEWADWCEDYTGLKFVSESGAFFLLAPFNTTREGRRIERLSALTGKLIDHREIPANTAVNEIIHLFGELRQPLTPVLPVSVAASAGLLSKQSGEAFIVPNGWSPVANGNGPALNNMEEQRRRFLIAEGCIQKIFDHESAEILLAPLRNLDDWVQTVTDEYQLHDFGHATGLGLIKKLDSGVLQTTYLGGVEEWRADGVAFELAGRMLPIERVGRILASNLVTRFGLDSHRRGRFLDTDVNAGLLTFNCLIEADAISVNNRGELCFTRSSLDSLIKAGAVDFLRSEAVRLTRNELRSSDPRSVWRAFNFTPNKAAELFFMEHVVTRCAGSYEELR